MFSKILIAVVVIITTWMIYEIKNAPELDEDGNIINKDKNNKDEEVH
jgi:hypothetical protein